MAKTSDISPNDKDLILAQQIGRALPNLSSLNAESDPLLYTLLEFKKSQKQANNINSNSIWNSIDEQINHNSAKGRMWSISPTIRRYAVAAAILLAAFVSILVYQDLSQPKLIAESLASSAFVTLPDGSEVTLRPYSRLFEIEQSQNLAAYELKGEAYFEVAENSSRTFSVQTNWSEVRVLGTRFVLSDWGNASTVYLQEGRIQYTSLGSQKSVELLPGQSSTVDQTNTIRVEEQASEEVFTDWMNNELIFKNETVRNVFNELEQHFNVSISAEENILDEELSGSIQLDNIDSVLRDLELVLDGNFTQTGQNSYVFKLN